MTLVLVALGPAASPVARAAGTVTDCTSYGFAAGTLAAALVGGGTVTFACSGTIIVPEISIAGSVVIDASGQQVTLSGNHSNRIFLVSAGGSLELISLTLTEGRANASNDPRGGAIQSWGTVMLTNSTVSNSVAEAASLSLAPGGGGIWNAGNLTVTASTVSFNRGGSGGGIWSSGEVTITASNLLGNSASYAGGGISSSGAMTVVDVTISSNRADIGGGVRSTGQLIAYDSTISQNSARSGGGLDTGGTSTLRNVDVSENSAGVGSKGGGYGGGIDNSGDLSIWGGIVSSNHAESGEVGAGEGGGIRSDGSLELHRVTLANNTAQSGGAVFVQGTAALVNSTLTNNSAGAGGGIFHMGIATLVVHTTLSGNSDPPPSWGVGIAALSSISFTGSIVEDACLFPGVIVDAGYNIESGESCGFIDPSSRSNTDPLIGPLQDNGGRTHTSALLPGSPAIDAIPATYCTWDDDGDPGTPEVPVVSDQRGVRRPQLSTCDIGAYEVTECANGEDDDGDAFVDGADPGCRDATSVREDPQCQDGINNDPGQDSRIDFDGGLSALGYVATSPDPQCVGKPWKNRESQGGCGLGFELALILPVLMRARRRIRPGRRGSLEGGTAMRSLSVALLGAALVGASPSLGETLEIPGLSAPATVQTDDLGTSHITAATLEDAFRVQGWVAARDRFFQMDRGRRASNGTLAALTGQLTDLQQDGLAKLVDIPGAARRSLERMTPEVRAFYQAYADGVNAWLATHALPGEYAELEVSRVPPWSVVDTVASFKAGWANTDNRLYELGDTDQLAEYVNAGPGCAVDGRSLFQEDVVRVAPFVPVATVPDGAATSSAAAPVVGPAARSLRAPIGAELAGALRRQRAGIRGLEIQKREPPRGSSAWGVAASKTASGAPLLASDGHLAPLLPAVVLPMHLVVTSDPVFGALNLSGAHAPGFLPGFDYVGQNQDLVWGGTAFFPDVMDFFADRLVRGDPACPTRLCIDSAGALHPVEESTASYRINELGPDGSGDGIPDNTRDATAAVAAQLPEAVRILRVPFRSFGPIYAVEDPSVVDDGGTSFAETEVVTVQYPGLHGTRDHGAHIDMMTATNVDEFVAAVRRFSQNHLQFVVADRSGGLAYVAGGEIPLRADLEAGSVHDDGPQFVRDGSGPANWISDPARSQGQDIPFAVIPPEDMPEIVNPPAGFVVTANNDPVEDTLDNDLYNQPRPSAPGTIRYVGASESAGLRAARATALLREKIDASELLTRDDMRRMQTDGTPHDATLLAPFLLTAWANAQDVGAPPQLAAFTIDAEVSEAVGRIAAWDFTAPTGIPEGWDASSYTADVDGVRSDPVPAEEVAASVANTIYQVWRAELIDDVIIAGLAGCGLQQNFDDGSMNALLQLLSTEPFTGVGASGLEFFADPVALAPADRRDVTLLQALRGTLDALASNRFSSAFANSTNQDDYRWGRLHRIQFEHSLGGDRSIPPAAGFEELDANLPGVSRDGAYGALNRTGRWARWFRASRPADFLNDDETGVAVLRWIAEPVPADGAEEGLWAISSLAGGASEDVDSPLYASRLARWLTGDYDDVLVTPAQIAPLPSEDAIAAEVSKGQRACVQEANKRGADVGKAQGKEVSSCLKLAAKGKEPEPQACLTADAKGKVAKAREKARRGEEKKCGERPAFAWGGADAASDAGADAAVSLSQDVFGADLDAVVIARSADKAGAGCQSELLKGSQKALESIWKEAGKAKKAALAGKQGASPATSGSEMHDALAAVFEPNAKVEKALGKIESGAAKKCAGVADLAAVAPGACADADVATLAACLRERVLCRACRSLNAMDAMVLPCDTLDDGEVDESCATGTG